MDKGRSVRNWVLLNPHMGATAVWQTLGKDIWGTWLGPSWGKCQTGNQTQSMNSQHCENPSGMCWRDNDWFCTCCGLSRGGHQPGSIPPGLCFLFSHPSPGAVLTSGSHLQASFLLWKLIFLAKFLVFFSHIYHLLFQLSHSIFLSVSGCLSCYSTFSFLCSTFSSGLRCVRCCCLCAWGVLPAPHLVYTANTFSGLVPCWPSTMTSRPWPAGAAGWQDRTALWMPGRTEQPGSAWLQPPP